MPKFIMHNQISLDGAVSGFQFDPGAYYGILNSFGAEMYLVASETAILGIKMIAKHVLKQEEKETALAEKNTRPYWVIPDYEGELEGLLNIYRSYEHCRDVIVLISQQSPPSYISYLDDNNFKYIIAGDVKVDFKEAFEKLNQQFPFKTLVTDNGGELSSILLENSLVDQISIIMSTTLTGAKPPKLFRELKLGKRVIKLNPVKVEIRDNKDILFLFDIQK